MAWNKEKAWYLLPFTGFILLLNWSISVEAQAPPIKIKDLERSIPGSIKCWVCPNVESGKACLPNDLKKKSSNKLTTCDFDHFKKMYGSSLDDELARFPDVRNFPSSWALHSEMNASYQGNNTNHKFITSGLSDLQSLGKLKYKVCVKQVITFGLQDNYGKGDGLTEQNPRIIRFCGFGSPDKDNECKKVKTGKTTVTTCKCKADGCNTSSVLRVSHWIFAAFLLVIGAQIAMKK